LRLNSSKEIESSDSHLPGRIRSQNNETRCRAKFVYILMTMVFKKSINDVILFATIFHSDRQCYTIIIIQRNHGATLNEEEGVGSIQRRGDVRQRPPFQSAAVRYAETDS
jgi:hypothetical protein